MIKIVETKKNKKKSKPYYELVYNYMIGDANGHTKEKVKLSIDNPHIERYCKLLNSLKPSQDTWGISLDMENLDSFLKEKQITKDEFDFLEITLFHEINEDEYLAEFSEGVRSETEYSFLVFEGVDLYYIDEFGIKNKTKFK